MIDHLDLSRKTHEGCVGIGQHAPSLGPTDENASTGQNHMKVLHRLRAAGSCPGLTDHVIHGYGPGGNDLGIAQHCAAHSTDETAEMGTIVQADASRLM